MGLRFETHGDGSALVQDGTWLVSHGPAFPTFDELSDQPSLNAVFFRTDEQKWYHWTGTEWAEIEANPRFNDEYWEDLRAPASSINPSGSANPPDVDANLAGTLLFAANSDEVIGIVMQMPHTWKEGSAIRPHVHWTPTNAAVGNVYWRLQYRICPIGDPIPGAWTTVNVLAATPGVAEQHTITSFGEIDMTDRTISCMLLFTLMRPGGSEATDTYDGQDVRLLEFDVHYQIDTAGSAQLFTKE